MPGSGMLAVTAVAGSRHSDLPHPHAIGNMGRVTSAGETVDGITLVHAPDRQRYELYDGEAVAGYVEYAVPDETHVDLVHTVVDPACRGRGIAGRVVAFALADIRAQDKRIIPHCDYVQHWLKEHPGYAGMTDWPQD